MTKSLLYKLQSSAPAIGATLKVFAGVSYSLGASELLDTTLIYFKTSHI